MIRVLHVAADFPNQDLYPRLVAAVAGQAELSQTVLSAVRSAAEANRILLPVSGVRYEFRHILRPAHRVLFRSKVRLIADTARQLAGFPGTQVVHAHSLYSDGAVALKLQRSHGIPYIAAVRNVDLHAFMRLRPDLSLVRDAVLRHAAAIVFLSPAYRQHFLERLPSGLARSVETKAHVIPNGVAPQWLEDVVPVRSRMSAGFRLLYVGDLSKNKNIRGILAALEILSRAIEVSLTVVGGTIEEARAAGLQVRDSLPVTFAGRISDPERLKEIYLRHDIFVMPSFTETFGIAYVEALSQGLPVIHSHGQGVAGYFEQHTVAEAVDPGSGADIARGVMALSSRIPHVCPLCMEVARRFDWSKIGARYVQLYEDAQRCPGS